MSIKNFFFNCRFFCRRLCALLLQGVGQTPAVLLGVSLPGSFWACAPRCEATGVKSPRDLSESISREAHFQNTHFLIQRVTAEMFSITSSMLPVESNTERLLVIFPDLHSLTYSEHVTSACSVFCLQPSGLKSVKWLRAPSHERSLSDSVRLVFGCVNSCPTSRVISGCMPN